MNLPIINRQHIFFITSTALIQVLNALVQRAAGNWWLCFLCAAMTAVAFFFKCHDRQFGNGRKFHWMRQTILGAAFVACLLIALV